MVALFRHTALVSLFVAALSLGSILRTWGSDHTKSLSSHGARHRLSYLLFAAGLVTAGALLCIFVFWWLMPTLHLTDTFAVVLVITLLCELIAAFVPDNGGRNSLIHRIGAWSMAVGMFILVLLLWRAPQLGHSSRALLAIFALYLAVDWCLFLFVKASRRYFLLFQSSYILCFYASLLTVAYIH